MNRREFVKVSGAAALASTIPFQNVISASLHSPKLKIKKSLKYTMVDVKMPIVDQFKMLRDIGFDGVEMDSPSDLKVDDVLEAKEKSGLEIPGVINSLHWKAPLSDPDPKVRAQCVKATETALRDCKAYGGTTVLLVPGVVNQQISYRDAYQRSQEEIKKVIPVAEETGVKIAFENVWNNFLLSPLEAARYVDEFESDMIGWYFDVGNIVRYGWPEHWIEVLGDRILKLDVKEYSRTKQQNEGIWKGFEVELLEGDCNWPEVNKALDKIGYEGWASAEVKGGGRERLATISKNMDAIFGLA
ncbi:sugar phosphate isomerase/epimerase family protein [Catalinimonas niigatensis]|uniref:sugar phosphate isomerase/epimerase family protein n=1 Tax=Catalinimonas niigatensis TaxID=1397264 RepID=UPI0026660725|nr:sugar phosphate isomerase/epimerase family protein [Catalinimonas niigatensis]WPP51416.1 sugar phosphate isomerase/epimerase family protein [Catalinimonas niigatensis]